MADISGEGLTARQFETLKVIATFIEEHGISPSFAEIGERMNLRNRGAVHRHVHALKERGRIEYHEGCSRSITIAKELTAPEFLGDALKAKLLAFCIENGERPTDVIATAVELHLDECERIAGTDKDGAHERAI